MMKGLSAFAASIILLSSCEGTTQNQPDLDTHTSTEQVTDNTTDTSLNHSDLGTDTSDLSTQVITDDETGTVIGADPKAYDCQWKLVEVAYDIYRIELDNIENCESEALLVNPIIDFGDGGDPITLTQDYLTYHMINDPNVDESSYSVKIYSNSNLVKDIEFQKYMTNTNQETYVQEYCYAKDSDVNLLVEQVEGSTVNPTIVNIDSQDIFCENSDFYHIYDVFYKPFELDFGDSSEPLDLRLGFYNHIYPSEGNYTATLSNDKSLTFNVSESNAQFNSTDCADSTPLISNIHSASYPTAQGFDAQIQSVSPDGCTYWEEPELIWDFGDGAVAQSDRGGIAHIFITPGTYPVTVKGASKYATVSRTILVDSNAEATNEGVCELLTPAPYLRFHTNAIANQSIEIDSTRLTFQIYDPCDTSLTPMTPIWDFGDAQGVASSDTLLTHQYSQSGEFTISVTFGYVEDNITVTKKVMID